MQRLIKIPFPVKSVCRLRLGRQEKDAQPSHHSAQMLRPNTGTVETGSNYSEILGPASLSSAVLGAEGFGKSSADIRHKLPFLESGLSQAL